MAAGLGFKTFTTGEVLTAADVNGYLMQGVLVFASAAARNAAITSPQEGQFAFTKDTNGLWYYDGAAWVASGATGDIEGVTAGVGISGGGTSGTVTITNSMATEITAKGDLIVGTGSATFDNLAAGSNGETLVADSTTSTGLRYQTGVNINGIINGGMDIWARGTSFAIPSSTYTYTADRWIGLRFSTGSTVSQQTASLDGFQYSARVARDSGNTGLGIIYLGYNLETADSYKYAGKTVTLSFWAKAGANFSSASSALSVIWQSGTGTNQKQMDGFTGSSNLANTSVTLTTSWQRFSFTAAVPSNSTQQGFQFNYTPVGTAGAADNFEIVGVQQEFGSMYTNFKRAGGGSIQGELAACQRYYYRSTPGTNFGNYGLGTAGSATAAHISIPLPVTMRIIPTSLDVPSTITTLKLTNITATNYTISAIGLNDPTQNNLMLAVTASGMTTNQSLVIGNNNNTAGFIGASAEL